MQMTYRFYNSQSTIGNLVAQIPLSTLPRQHVTSDRGNFSEGGVDEKELWYKEK